MAAPDDNTLYPWATAIGTEALIPSDNPNWLHPRLHNATQCRSARREAPPADGPAAPPPPDGTRRPAPPRSREPKELTQARHTPTPR
ncbi:hypothetical protein [Streptomyces longisporoflavus]|uniref:hypothetical protein n=1 Tax=Streptomyces longisporoflavus TaxID=28044 RepID=UPI00167CB1EA|nr:hypothetical protein [Streptomyces longisporoflavus]